MTITDLTVLDQFRRDPLPADWDLPGVRTLYSPIDQVHAALVLLISSAETSLDLALYGFDDQELADVIEAKLRDAGVAVTLTLDSSQAGGVHERRILAAENYPATSIAVGRSERGAIIHLKEVVVDGKIRISGSTNWSGSGEGLQDNEMTVIMDDKVAAEATKRLMELHHWVICNPSHKP